MIKTYVVAPNFSIPPGPKVEGSVPISSEGRLQLGDIITNPFGPKPLALNRYDRTPIKKEYLEKPDEKTDVQRTAKDLWSGRLGIWASLLATLGIGAAVDVSIHAQSKSTDVLTIKTLETYEFDVRDDYVREVLASKSVAAYIKEFSGKAGQRVIPLYLVCGLKIARGASSTSTEFLEAGGNVGASGGKGDADAKLFELLWKRYRGVSFKTSTDFVLAFQLLHVKYNVETQELKTEVSVRNASMADGTGKLVDAAVEYEGVDGDLSGARNDAQDVIERRDDELSEMIMIPDME